MSEETRAAEKRDFEEHERMLQEHAKLIEQNQWMAKVLAKVGCCAWCVSRSYAKCPAMAEWERLGKPKPPEIADWEIEVKT